MVPSAGFRPADAAKVSFVMGIGENELVTMPNNTEMEGEVIPYVDIPGVYGNYIIANFDCVRT
jgi:hypothetical protein